MGDAIALPSNIAIPKNEECHCWRFLMQLIVWTRLDHVFIFVVHTRPPYKTFNYCMEGNFGGC